MTTYKEIFGKPIKYLNTNPDNSSAEGQIWYNSTDGTFKTVVTSTAWSTSSPMLVKSRLMAGFGINTAAVSAGGNTDTANIATTQHYNGTGWDLGGNLPEARFNAGGLGVETAGMSVGGGDPPGARSVKTFEYDGTSWTAGGDLTEEREGPFSFGTETAGVAAGGETLLPPGVTQAATVDEYNGSSWTAVNSMSNARYLGAACGTETAGVVFGGETSGGGGYITATELYDGTNWTAGGNAPSSQKYAQAASGQQTDALLINGFGPPYTTAVTEYNGSSFTTGQSTVIPRSQLGASKQQSNTTSALAYGGVNPGVTGGPRLTNTEEYATSINVITAAAWASGPTLNTGGRNGSAGGGTSTAAIMAGGGLSTVINNAEQYNGSSWSNIPTIGTARGYMAGATNGPSTSNVVFGGSTGSGVPNVTAKTEEYSGSSWAEQTDLSSARNYLAGFGTQTAAVAAGGQGPVPSPPNRLTAVEEYNGSSWTSGTSFPTGAFAWGGCGTETAGLVVGDVPGKAGTYNGSSWTTISYLNAAGNYNKVVGTSTAAVQAGRNPTSVNQVEEWDGTSWFTSAQLATARFNGLNAGTSTSSLVAGPTTATEEFTAESSAVNVKTISTS